MRTARILVVDDESALRTGLHRLFTRNNYQVVTAGSAKEALSLTASTRQNLDLAFVDLQLPDGNGLDLMEKLKVSHPNLQVIVLTGFGTVQNAVSATQRGAFHFLTKPFNMDELLSLTQKALENQQLRSENKILKNQLHEKYKFENIIGQSSAMTQVMELIDRVSKADSTVLITGESGTGKELVARAIHFNSNRAEKMLVPVNCGAIPGELLESELFGHVKGAFTGATSARVGRFELANEGTIFLDEIGDMSPNLQVKILRVLQEQNFEPVGSTKTVKVDDRIIAATNIDLEKAVGDGQFREDLYYRLNVIPIHIAPLRERQEDIPLLIHHFIEIFNRTKGSRLQGVSPEAMECFREYQWPGNVRELENLLERVSILKGEGIIQPEDLPEKFQLGSNLGLGTPADASVMDFSNDGLDFNSAVDAYENRLILKALESTGWNRNQAARLLRLNRTTLVEKIKKKGLRPPENLV